MANRLVVFDPEIEAWLDNRIFDEAFAREWPGALHWARLAELAARKGISIETIDRFLSRRNVLDASACLMTQATCLSTFTRKVLAEQGAFAGICVCLESPFVAHDFYHNLEAYSSWFRHVFTFAGAKERVTAPGTIFHPIVWPYESREVIPGTTWSARQYLTLINSNRRAEQNIFPRLRLWHPRSSFLNLARFIRTRAALRKDPWFGRELYVERLAAIRYFAREPGFDLFGRGWDKPVPGVADEFNRAVQKCFRGEIPPLGKVGVLSRYRFAICFENSSFPGYITEKILDCFCAGCIPVYLGAPDVDDFIPPEAFIDFRRVSGYGELDTFLKNMTEEQAAGYREAGRTFLASSGFDQFDSEGLACQLMAAVEDCFAQMGHEA